MQRQAGFTLLELIVAIIILITLAGITIPIANGLIEDARIARAIDFSAKVANACRHHFSNTGRAPASLDALWEQPSGGVEGWNGPYLDRPVDANDNPFGGALTFQQIEMELTPGELTSAWVLEMTGLPRSASKKIDAAVDKSENSQQGLFQYTIGNPVDVGVFYLMPASD